MNSYRGKQVAILGFGLNGEDTFRYLSSQSAHITIIDQKSATDLEPQLVGLPPYPYRTKFGKHYLNNLTQFDCIFRSPGVRRLLPQLHDAEKHGVKVTSPTIEFFSRCPCRIIGVTGTKGKGTTSTLIYSILKATKIKAHLAGNIGIPMLDLLPKLTPDDWVILEISSFQLQDLYASPHIAVITNLMSDHLDYHQSQEEYLKAKLNIIKFQSPTDIAILNLDDPVTPLLRNKFKGRKYYFTTTDHAVVGSYVTNQALYLSIHPHPPQQIIPLSQIKLRGEHNLANIAAASVAAYIAGAPVDSIGHTISKFRGLEHRLEFVTEINKVKYYNDSFGTTPETAIAALKSFTEPVILIAGGSEKQSDYTPLAVAIASRNVKAVILIGDTAPKIKMKLMELDHTIPLVEGLTNMRQIVKAASRIALPGEVVLLSPASASFGLFKNYKERGNLFKDAVMKLKNSPEKIK